MTGMQAPGRKYLNSPPYDSDDFGRCFRLLERFPHWRDRMPEVAEKYKGYWADLVEVWEECEKIYKHCKPHYNCVCKGGCLHKKIYCTQFLRALHENYSYGTLSPKEVLARFIEEEKIKL
jgi:hypothetical protein